jgi:putative ATP-binding cassette transporter
MRTTWPLLTEAWRLARPYFSSEEKWTARFLLAAIVVLNLGLVGMDVVLSFWNREFYNALQGKDWDSFVALLFMGRHGAQGYMPGYCLVAAVYILVAVYRTYLNQWLQIRWRRWMTDVFLQKWLADRAYYRISLGAQPGDGTDNPDQRIAEDLRSFVGDTLSLGLDLLSNVVSLFSFVAILWSLSGPMTVLGIDIPGYMVWVALLYALAGSVLTQWIGKPLSALNFRQQQVEADFRFAMMRLRENTEGVALSRGEAEEQRGLRLRFGAVADNWWAIMRRTKMLNGLVAGYSQVAVVFPIIVAAPRFFAGKMELGELTQTAGAFSQVQSAMSWFVTSYSSLASWRATVHRLAGFEAAIAAARSRHDGPVMEQAPDAAYALTDVTLRLPDGRVLMHDVSLRVEPGQWVVISGPSGLGKSTLFRALAGIWPFGDGIVSQPPGRSMFLPQRPYLPLGTLRHAVTYPAAPDAYSDAAIETALQQAGLTSLASRLNDEDAWAQRLSGGEQQRLALARVLLERPDWLFLDEASASLDPQAEAELYATIRRVLPDATVVSIAHRTSVAALHEREVQVRRLENGDTGLTETRTRAAE